MSNSQLLDATYIDGLRMPNYVNGRLLSAEDLKADQGATLARLAWLGKAVGHGIVEGLWVAQLGSTSLQVNAGLGINRLGQLVRLPGPVTLNLVPDAGSAVLTSSNGRFQDCSFDSATPGGPGQDGAYLLTAVPSARLEGQAPVQKAAGATLSPGCAFRWEVDGLQFKAIRLAGFGSGGSEATVNNRRNLLAHWCFGSQALRRLPLDPFIFDDAFTGLDGLPVADLSECDLPLAVFYWRAGKLDFVDAWPARRRLTQPGPWQSWRGLLADSRVSLAQARFLQFQGEVERLLAGGSAGAIKAASFFRFLPPVGYLPIRPPAFLVQAIAESLIKRVRDQPVVGKATAAGSPVAEAKLATLAKGSAAEVAGAALGTFAGEAFAAPAPASSNSSLLQQVLNGLPATGFDLQTFFGDGLPDRVELIDGESVDFYLQRSWYDEAIDLWQPSSHIEVYLARDVWERVVGQRLISVLNAQLGFSGVDPGVRRSLLDGLARAIPPEIPGGQDRLHAMFVKAIAPRVAIAVRKSVAPVKPVLTGAFEVWHGYDRQSAVAAALEQMASGLEEANPGLRVDMIPQDGELMAKLQVAVPAGEGPDLVLADNTQVSALAEAAVIQPIDKVLERAAAVATVAYNSLAVEKTLYGVPQSFELAALFYNRAELSEPPATHRDLLVRTRILQGRVAFPDGIYFHYGFFPAFGGEVIENSGRCIADRGGVADAMQFLLNLQNVGAQFVDYGEAQKQFSSQDTVMMIDGPWAIATYREALGTGLAVAPLPAGTMGPAQPLLRVEGYLVPAFVNSVGGSVKLAELLTSAQSQEYLAQKAGKVPVRGDTDVEDELILGFMQAAISGRPMPRQPQFNAFWDPFQALVEDVLRNQVNPVEAVAKATRAMNVANGF